MFTDICSTHQTLSVFTSEADLSLFGNGVVCQCVRRLNLEIVRSCVELSK